MFARLLVWSAVKLGCWAGPGCDCDVCGGGPAAAAVFVEMDWSGGLLGLYTKGLLGGLHTGQSFERASASFNILFLKDSNCSYSRCSMQRLRRAPVIVNTIYNSVSEEVMYIIPMSIPRMAMPKPNARFF